VSPVRGRDRTHNPGQPGTVSILVERGISVDRDWDDAVTAAVLEFAQAAHGELWPAYQHRHRERQLASRELLTEFLRDLLNLAFRAEIDAELAERLIHKQLQQEPDDGEATKRVLLLGLKSPRFLYPQLDSSQNFSQKAGARLALTMLDSLPVDKELQAAMDQDKLQTEDQVRSMARYLLDDYRLRAKTHRMLLQWLHIDLPRDIRKSDHLYPGFDPPLASDLMASLHHFLNAVVWSESSDYRQFFTADWGFTTDRIEQFYGSTWSPAVAIETDVQRQTAVQDAIPPIPIAVSKSPRKSGSNPHLLGLLTHPYMMSRLAYHDATSPIHRGVFLLRYILGRQLQPPQDAFAPLSPDLHPELTTRQRVELQTSPESCQACHQQINDLGFSLENWDAVGQFRTEEKNQPLNVRGRYVTRHGHEIQFRGAGQLAEAIVASRDAHEAFVRRAFQHFVQQPPAAFGPDTLDRMTDRFIRNDYNIRELLVDIAVTAAMWPVP